MLSRAPEHMQPRLKREESRKRKSESERAQMRIKLLSNDLEELPKEMYAYAEGGEVDMQLAEKDLAKALRWEVPDESIEHQYKRIIATANVQTQEVLEKQAVHNATLSTVPTDVDDVPIWKTQRQE